jgi:hypothetical protein
LNRDHERIGKDQSPEQAKAELRAGLGVGGDTARVVIRRAGNQARSETLHPGPSGRVFDDQFRFQVFFFHCFSLRERDNEIGRKPPGLTRPAKPGDTEHFRIVRQAQGADPVPLATSLKNDKG